MHALVAEPGKIVTLAFSFFDLVLLDSFFEGAKELVIEIGMVLQQAVRCRVFRHCIRIFDHLARQNLLHLVLIDFFDR